MDKQTITITLKEYKKLRNLIEEYQKLQGDYNFLYYVFNQQNKKEPKEKIKTKIGF